MAYTRLGLIGVPEAARERVARWNRKIRIAQCNSFAEVPPLACFPVRKRNTGTWLATGDYWAGVYDWSQLHRLIISAQNLAFIENTTVDAPEGSEVLTGVPTGWRVWQYAPALDNTETNWRIVVGTARIAFVRPWHGFYCLVGEQSEGTEATWVSYHVSPARRHAVVKADSASNVSVGVSPNTPSLELTFVSAGWTATAGCIRWLIGGYLGLWTVEGGTVQQRPSEDEGTTWGMATSIGAGTQVTACISPQRVRYIYRRTSAGAIVVQVRDSDDNVLIADTTVIASGVDNASIDCEYRPLGNGLFEIVLWYIATGTLTETYSNDGVTFS